MEKKKPTNAELQRRIDKALIHIDKTKDTQSIYFSDKGLRLTTTDEYAIIETNYHRHVFSAFTQNGYSRPWLYTKHVVETAMQTNCESDGGYSYQKMRDALNDGGKVDEYNLVTYYEWYIQTIFDPLYAIGESRMASFMVYESYIHILSKNGILLDEVADGEERDITSRQFIDMVCDKMKEFGDSTSDYIVIKKKNDEEIAKEEIAAMNEQEIDANDGN